MPLLLEQAKELSWPLYAGENRLRGPFPGLVLREGFCIILGRASGVNPFCWLCSRLLSVQRAAEQEEEATRLWFSEDEEGKEQGEKRQIWMPLGF